MRFLADGSKYRGDFINNEIEGHRIYELPD